MFRTVDDHIPANVIAQGDMDAIVMMGPVAPVVGVVFNERGGEDADFVYRVRGRIAAGDEFL